MTKRRTPPRRPTTMPEFPYWLGLTEPQIRELADGKVSARVQRSARECLYPTWLRKRRKATT
jgi:hypothetical protein